MADFFESSTPGANAEHFGNSSMINFPILQRLDITGYGLYPGDTPSESGLHVEFQPGLTLVLGTNGLGKSTLVRIIYRLLTGPYDISGLAGAATLGNMSLSATPVKANERHSLGQRVVDGARNATARLSLAFGAYSVIIERRLSDLLLTYFSVDGQELPCDEKANYQEEILRLVGLCAFGDWILLLQHLVFYFEDRRALVWDSSAQTEILRILLLPPYISEKWTRDKREILELDSRVRNSTATLNREERDLAFTDNKVAAGADVRQELKVLQELQEIDLERRAGLETGILDVENLRQSTRLRAMTAEQEHESRFRDLERAKLTAIGARFPNRCETARYILAQLMTENRCLVCDNVAPQAAAEYASRLTHTKCIVCGSDLSGDDSIVPAPEVADKRVDRATSELTAVAAAFLEAKMALEEAEGQYVSLFTEIQELNAKIAERSYRIDGLVNRLPPEDTLVHQQRSELTSIRSRVESLRIDLEGKRKAFQGFVEELSGKLVTYSEKIKETFNQFAEGFLLESCRLVWSPQRAPGGVLGAELYFPSFEIEMTGSDFPSPVRRSGPDKVSESQREFIDLAFRMSLMQVAGSTVGATLMIDAPESSLDAVFVTRAANVLARYAEPQRNNRLIITSNLIEGRLIPKLMEKAMAPSERHARIVDLLDLAAPTAAVRELRAEYEGIRDSLMGVAE